MTESVTEQKQHLTQTEFTITDLHIMKSSKIEVQIKNPLAQYTHLKEKKETPDTHFPKFLIPQREFQDYMNSTCTTCSLYNSRFKNSHTQHTEENLHIPEHEATERSVEPSTRTQRSSKIEAKKKKQRSRKIMREEFRKEDDETKVGKKKYLVGKQE